MAAVAAGPAYPLLGKKDLGATDMPPPETAVVDGELVWRTHKGGHTTGPNLDTFVAWAVRYLTNSSPRPLPRRRATQVLATDRGRIGHEGWKGTEDERLRFVSRFSFSYMHPIV